VMFVKIDPTCEAAALGASRRHRLQRHSVEEGKFHIAGEAMKRCEIPASLHPVEGRVPAYGLLHPGYGFDDELVEPPSECAFPPRHRADIGFNRRIAICLWKLRITSGQQPDSFGFLPGQWTSCAGAQSR